MGENILVFFFFFQAEDGIRDLVRSRGLGDVYKRQVRRLGCLAQPITAGGKRIRISLSSVMKLLS